MNNLNNSGFTLIELLAVIVILAVVMGVATTSVLSAMNNSRKESLLNSAKTAADAFRVEYSEMALRNGVDFFNFSAANTKELLSGFKSNGNVSTGIRLSNANMTTDYTGGKLGLSVDNYDLYNSWVYFKTDSSSFVVCLTANANGSYYVHGARQTKNSNRAILKPDGTSYLKCINYDKKVNNVAQYTERMWACSDGTTSWIDGQK